MDIINSHPYLWEVLRNSLYLLHWEPVHHTLSLLIDKKATEKLTELLGDNPLVNQYKTVFFPEHTSFIPSFETEHGFNSCGKVTPDFSEQYMKVDFALQPLYLLGGTCTKCRGRGKKGGRTCMDCFGRKKKLTENKVHIHAVTNTIALLLTVLDFYPHALLGDKTNDEWERLWPDQLYILRTISDRDREGYGHATHGGQSPKFTKALREYYVKKKAEGVQTNRDSYLGSQLASEAMLDAYLYLTNEGKPNSFYGNIAALVLKKGGFYVETEGQNGCTISTCYDGGMNIHWYRDKDSAPISCHNLDSALQQVVLLVGIARLSECVFLNL